MNLADIALEKLLSVEEQLLELESVEYPHETSKDALKVIVKSVRDRKEALSNQPPEFLHAGWAEEVTLLVVDVLEYLGLIVNSASVRNSFEVHAPLYSMAKKLIGPDVRLILTFEWNYIPFTYPQNIALLPEFIVIGLPASEAGNALIIPSAGHELGHSIWRNGDYDHLFGSALQDHIKNGLRGEYLEKLKEFHPDVHDLDDYNNRYVWESAYEWSLGQTQELFCDVVGLFIFGESYLRAFEYLLAPQLTTTRSEAYPKLRTRANLLGKAASSVGLGDFHNFLKNFQDESTNNTGWILILENLADNAAIAVFDEMVLAAVEYCRGRDFSPPIQDDWNDVCAAFKDRTPLFGAAGLPHVINAAWQLYLDADFVPTNICGGKRRLAVLNELVLKTIEMLEISELLHESAAPC